MTARKTPLSLPMCFPIRIFGKRRRHTASVTSNLTPSLCSPVAIVRDATDEYGELEPIFATVLPTCCPFQNFGSTGLRILR
jgi:hypothetical protein